MMKKILALLLFISVPAAFAQVTHLGGDDEAAFAEENPGLVALQKFADIMRRYQVDPQRTAQLVRESSSMQEMQANVGAYVQRQLGSPGLAELQPLMTTLGQWTYSTLDRTRVLMEGSAENMLSAAQEAIDDESMNEPHFTESFALMTALEQMAHKRTQEGLGSSLQTRKLKEKAGVLRSIIETRYGIKREFLEGILL